MLRLALRFPAGGATEDLMTGNELEKLPSFFHTQWLLILMGLALLILLLSTASLFSARRTME